jgi:AhpD family alkylhydroperoxidase
MKARLNPFEAAPKEMKAWLDCSNVMHQTKLEPRLMYLVQMRASQINGCAVCLNMHSADARKAGETEQRLYVLDAWRDSPLYSERERAALGWTEALTLIAQTHAPDEAYQALAAQFSEEERVQLSLMIVTINGWNRLMAGFHVVHPVADEQLAA